jgi:hypothetical protein
MIKIEHSPDGTSTATQTNNLPTVYLDQWMWSRLSRKSETRAAFLAAAKMANATIMYSWTTFLELGKLSDQGQLEELKVLMDDLDFAFIETNPRKVIEREKKSEVEPGNFVGANPAVDRELIDFVSERTALDAIPRVSLILDDVIRESPGRYKTMAQSIGDHLTATVEQVRRDPRRVERAKHRLRKRQIFRGHPPYTQDLLSTVVNFIVANEKMGMPAKEWLDVQHLVVPVSYLTFVLLDKRWKSFVNNIFPVGAPHIARVFRGSSQELPQFFEALRNFHSRWRPGKT